MVHTFAVDTAVVVIAGADPGGARSVAVAVLIHAQVD